MIKNINLTSLIFILAISFSGCSLLSGPATQSPSATKPESSQNKPQPVSSETQEQLRMAVSFLMQGDNARALAELRIAKEMAPENANVENFLGLTYYRMKDYSLAIESFHKALQLDPARTDVHNNLGLVYLDQRDYNRALAEFNLCIKDLNYQKKHLPLNNIGLVYLEMGQPEQALAALTRATEVSPDYAKSYQLIGRVYLNQGMYQDAITSLEKAISIEPNDPETQAALASATAALGGSSRAGANPGGV